MSIEIVGEGLLVGNLERIGAQIEAETPAALEHGAADIRDAWVGNITSEGLVLTGRYRDSVRVERDGEHVVVRSDVEYAPYLEYGTSHQVGHHVAERAFGEHVDDALDKVADELGKVLR